MVTSSWLMVLPEGFTPEKFDGWYLYTHTDVAKHCQDLTHYTVNRAFADQPSQSHEPADHGKLFRIAQLWWDTPEKLQESFNSYSGSAVRGDAFLNVSLEAAVHPSVAFTEDTQFEVRKPAVWSMFQRGYVGNSEGTIVKVLGYGLSDDRDIADWYAKTYAGLGEDERVRTHIFGKGINRKLPIGLEATLPGDAQVSWDWMVELWFDSSDEARGFIDSEPFASAWSDLAERSGDTLLSVLRGQEMFVNVAPIDHVE